jgi:hypothetical protein
MNFNFLSGQQLYISILTSTIYNCLNVYSDKMMRREFQLDKKAEKWYSTSNEFNVIVVWHNKQNDEKGIETLFSRYLLF